MITEDQIFNALRAFILPLAAGQRVLRTPINRAAMPVIDGKTPATSGFVALTPGARKPLSTNSSTQDDANTRNVRRPSQFDVQVDCYGPQSGDLAEQIAILFRDPYGADALAASGFEIAPLYADDAQQMPLVDGESQYVERWTFKLAMQVNQVVPTGQQSANMATVDLVNVDSTYPPSI